MALSKEDRIAFTKKIVEADQTLATFDASQAQLLQEKQKALKLDEGHKTLLELRTLAINAYQNELAQLDGIVRTQTIEQHYIDSANFVYGNIYYPNVPGGTPPSINPNVWTKTKPYLRTYAIGKDNNEAYPGTTPTEQSKINAVKAAITAAETFLDIQRTTGQTCYNGFCSLPAYLTQTDCTSHGGTWTPGPPDNITTYPAVVTALNNLVTAVQDYKNFLIAEAALIYTNDFNSTRQAQNNIALNNINSVIIPAINTWQAYPNFNNAHGQTTCAGFFAFPVSSLGPTKLRSTELNALKAAINARESFVTTRITQLTNNLGSVTQNLSDGSITGSGLYFERATFINLRLALLGGSLIDLLGYDRAVNAQNDLKNNIISAKNTYLSLLACTAFAAPANNTNNIHVKSSAGFSVGDTVYIVSETQEEIVRTISAIVGNRIVLGQPVSSKYRESELARMYKEL